MEPKNRRIAEQSVKELISRFDDSNREGLKETPKRYVKFLDEFLNPPEFNFTTFDSEGYDQMLISKDIHFFSLCEHHLAPFFGTATVAYLPNEKIVGLSKLARTVELYSRRLQNQERITKQVADRLMEELQPRGVAVTLQAVHLCMSMRGVRKQNVQTITSEMQGLFRTNSSLKAEFLQLAHPR